MLPLAAVRRIRVATVSPPSDSFLPVPDAPFSVIPVSLRPLLSAIAGSWPTLPGKRASGACVPRRWESTPNSSVNA
ncbi:hypothetical protein MRX96_009904 [Rhipicephalus microplus]